MTDCKIYCAPLQGFTEAAWRNAHAEVYDPGVVYFTPFVRVEKGQVRCKDLKDATSPLNDKHVVVPQIIFKDAAEFTILVGTLVDRGINRIDLNLGCPFPPQCHKGRGAAMLLNHSCLAEIGALMRKYPAVTFSVKMRIGLDDPHQWESAMPYINDMPLSHVAVHPRIATQQYKGEIYFDEVDRLLLRSEHPIIYNGDINSLSSYNEITKRFPDIKGVMIGRGVLARPSLFNEIIDGEEWSYSQRINRLLELHEKILSTYRATLCGPSQILSKIQPFWTYMDDDIDRKLLKRITKTNNLDRYEQAVAMVRSTL